MIFFIVLVWDMRSFKKPVQVWSDLPTSISETDVIYSPDQTTLVAGLSYADRNANGKLVFLNTSDGTVRQTVETDSGVTRIAWCAKSNQLAVGGTDSSVSMMFDSHLSTKGILLSVAKVAKQKTVDAFIPYQYVFRLLNFFEYAHMT